MMKRKLWKFAKLAALVIGIIIVGAVIFAVVRVRSAWPQVEGEARLPGLASEVELVRDSWGVPHIWAETEGDLFFAQGYAHAQDRLWQMHFNRTVARGRLAALFGAAALPADRYLRTLGLARAAEKDWELLTQESRAALEAYAAGVNAFLTHGETALPVEFLMLGVDPEPWSPIDSLAFSKAMSLNLSLNSPLEMLRVAIGRELGDEAPDRLLPLPGPDEPVIVGSWGASESAGETTSEGGSEPASPEASLGGGSPEPSAFASRGGAPSADALLSALLPNLADPTRVGGSNAWVVHGSRTASGKPLLANDTHLGLGLPSVWYENGLHAPELDVVGFSLPGVPLVVIGQNRRVAWGITNLNADVQDLFYERLDDAENPTRYETTDPENPEAGPVMRELTVIEETLEVKGGEPEILRVLLTHHGPLLHDVAPVKTLEEPYSMTWPALEGGRLIDALYRLNRAADWPSFRQALSFWDSPSLSFLYADVDGNIGYQATALTPIRPAGSDGSAPVPGWTGEHEWQGFIPFEELPHILNPPEGFIVSANNRVAGDDYPHLLTMDWPPADRAQRIRDLLSERTGLTLDDMRTMQADTYSLGAERLRPYLLAAVEPEGEAEERALELVRDWDLRYDADSRGALVYHLWLAALVEDLLGDELSAELMKSYGPIALSPSPFLVELMDRPDDPLFDDRRSEGIGEDRDALIAASFRRAVAGIPEVTGAGVGEKSWGDAHVMSFGHIPLGQGGPPPLQWLFNSETVPAAGSGSTIRANVADPARPFRVVFGVSQRYLADLADLSRSRSANSTGQSSQLFHRHREDQVALWRDVGDHPVVTRKEALDTETSSLLTLRPAASAGEPRELEQP